MVRRSADPAERQHLLAEWVAATKRRHGLNTTDAYVLMGLTLWADNDTGILYPSKRTIAEHLGIGVDAVRDSRKRMVEAGVIEVVDNRGGSQASVMRLVGYGDRHSATFDVRPVSAGRGRQRRTPRAPATPGEPKSPVTTTSPRNRDTPSGATTRTTSTSITKASSTYSKESTSTRANVSSTADHVPPTRWGNREPVKRGASFTYPRRYDRPIRATLERAGSAGVAFNALSIDIRSTFDVDDADAFENFLDDRLLYFEHLGLIRCDDKDHYWVAEVDGRLDDGPIASSYWQPRTVVTERPRRSRSARRAAEC